RRRRISSSSWRAAGCSSAGRTRCAFGAVTGTLRRPEGRGDGRCWNHGRHAVMTALLLFLGRTSLRKLSADDVDLLLDAGAIKERDLVYAAWARCACGEGLAHVRGSREWTCSAVLLGEVAGLSHEDFLPFDRYSIPAEGDPMCPGESTRPGRAA